MKLQTAEVIKRIKTMPKIIVHCVKDVSMERNKLKVLCVHSYLKMVLLRLKRTNLGIKAHRAFVCTLSNIF